MTQLLGLVILFLAATVFDVNEGVALTPLMVLYLLVFVTAAGVVVIALDPGDPDVMHRPPRDPKVPITNRTAITMWLIYGAVLATAAFLPLVIGPDDPSTSHPSASLTMAFVVMGLGTVGNAITNRRDPASGVTPPLLKAVGVSLVPVTLVFLATQLPGLQRGMLTQSLTGPQWLLSIGLALLLPLVGEVGKVLRRGQAPSAPRLDVEAAVAPARGNENARQREGVS
jgi:Ca2+-transporting ATPase